MSVVNSTPLLAAAGGEYQIERSLRFRSSASAYLNRTPAVAGNQRTWTMSMWVKRGALGVRQFITMSGTNPNPSQVWQVEFDANNKLDFYNQTIGTYRRTTQVFRDTGAWYHIVFGADTNNATAQNRFRCWINGVEVTAWDVNSTISSGYSFAYNGAYLHGIGAYTYSGNGLPLDGYLTEVNFIDGQALTPSSFGETDVLTGVWKPKKYAGTYGTNGFYLNFSDNSAATAAAIGADSSGNGNNWTPNNISVTSGVTYDSMIDVPTPYADGGNGRGNYAVMNPTLQNSWWAAVNRATIQDGNLTATGSNVAAFSNWDLVSNSGKWYCEVTAGGSDTASAITIGALSRTTYEVSYYQVGTKQINGTTPSSYGSSWTTNDVIGVAVDVPNNTVTFYKNNVSQGAISNAFPSGQPVYIGCYLSASNTMRFNFGQRPFAYTPPTGFKALNTQNLPEPTIVDGGEYFDVSLFTGTGASQNVSNSGAMQPDLVWVKSRSVASSSHFLYDSVRGTTKSLTSNNTTAELTAANTLTAFNSDGFTVSTGLIQSGQTYVGWQWKANGAGVTNTAGSITSNVSANTTAGFSVVTYTGTGANATVGHGLGVAPKMVIVKMRVAGGAWCTYHASVGATGALFLDQTGAANTSATYWNNTAPASSVFTIGTNGNVNQAQNFVAYCFSEVAGYSKFGSYTGNGSADGPFVFCGFRPRYVLIRDTGVADWDIQDTARSPFNTSKERLWANLSSAEVVSTYDIDFLSNGFKIRSTNPDTNSNGGTKIFAAFAEHPFKNSLAR